MDRCQHGPQNPPAVAGPGQMLFALPWGLFLPRHRKYHCGSGLDMDGWVDVMTTIGHGIIMRQWWEAMGYRTDLIGIWIMLDGF